jgi:hypothetical protein
VVGIRRVIRGGSWYFEDPYDYRTSYRAKGKPSDRIDFCGFRCCSGTGEVEPTPLASKFSASEPFSAARPEAAVRYQLVERDHSFAILDHDGKLMGEILPAAGDSIQAADAVEGIGDGVFRWRRTFRLKDGQPKQAVRLSMDFQTAYKSRFSVIPGISWNGNVNDPGNVYHGFELDGVPWSFASHRTLIPGGTYSEGDRHSVGLFAGVDDPQTGLSCSLIPSETTTVHRLIVPEEEMPERVLQREKGLGPGRANVLEMAPGDQRRVTAWLVFSPVTRPKTGYRHLLDAAWAQAFKETAACHAAGELWTMGIRFAKESLWDDQAKMFHLALACQNNRQWSQAGGFSIGWCGRNGELANALLVDYLKSKDTGSRDMALACLDAWARLAIPEPAAANPKGTVPAETIRPLVGSWTVTYSNGVVANLRFRPDGHIDPHPSWGRGTLRVVQDGGLACDWSNGQREQYRLAEGRLVVEHWFQNVKYTGQGVSAGALALFKRMASDANTLSDGAMAFLLASELSRPCGVDRPVYRELGLGICDAALAMQKPDGRFEGPGCERGGIGASFIPPLLTAHRLTSKPQYRDAAASALRFYVDMLYRDGCLWGGALDTRSIDRETVLPLLAGSIRLFELTREARYLTYAEDAGYYLAAWQIHQSIPGPAGSLMDTVGYDTFSGTSVATVHMCADPYGVAAVPWLLRLARHTGRGIWAQRAIALWNNGSQGISTGTLAVQGLPVRPCGSQDETVNYTDWGYDYLAQGMDRENPRGAGQCWLTAWPTAMRLTVLADTDIREQIETWPVRKGALPPQDKP